MTGEAGIHKEQFIPWTKTHGLSEAFEVRSFGSRFLPLP